ncbi:M23 family metallopeptidase [Candidatus Gracilibacteria bacterium]|nr:M23 family metallopeptidase [Candidatus Gracilibacteria bacterium]
MKSIVTTLGMGLIGLMITSCTATSVPVTTTEPTSTPPPTTQVVAPIAEYGQRNHLKSFGEYIQDRFVGYHLADDIEYTDTTSDTPVYSIAAGTVEYSKFTSGYGGMIKIKHTIDNQQLHAIYGHLDLASSSLKVGDQVKAGQLLANLGKDKSSETDGERKHLHFGLYKGNEDRINGYGAEISSVDQWLNPSQFLIDQGVDIHYPKRTFIPTNEIGGQNYQLQFQLPSQFEIEYIPSTDTQTIFKLRGESAARNRAEMIITSATTATNNLTDKDTKEIIIGKDNTKAQRHKLKTGITSTSPMPQWFSKPHDVITFPSKDNRFYTIHINPGGDTDNHQEIITSIQLQ